MMPMLYDYDDDVLDDWDYDDEEYDAAELQPMPHPFAVTGTTGRYCVLHACDPAGAAQRFLEENPGHQVESVRELK